MASGSDLHEKLGELVGLAQAVQRLVRHAMTLLERELELDLLFLLERLAEEMADVQRRCDTAVATHTALKLSRITGEARRVRASALQLVPKLASTSELLRVLAIVIDAARLRWRALASSVSAEANPSLASLVSSAIVLHEHHGEQIARHIRERTLGTP